jgi:hypothetical protein
MLCLCVGTAHAQQGGETAADKGTIVTIEVSGYYSESGKSYPAEGKLKFTASRAPDDNGWWERRTITAGGKPGNPL